MNTEKDALVAVEKYVYDRHGRLRQTDVLGFIEEERERLRVDRNGYLVFTVERVGVVDKDENDEGTLWYVDATLVFHVTSGDPIEGSTDTYEAYVDMNGTWCVEWYSS